MKLSIIITNFNEAGTIQELLNRVWLLPLPGFEKELVLVESNSADGSRHIVQKFAEEKQDAKTGTVKLILEARPSGKGHAVRRGASQLHITRI